NADAGNSGGFAEVPGTTPWSRYQVLEYWPGPNQVLGKIGGAATSALPTLDNTVVGESVDNAGAVEWDDHAAAPLNNGQTATYEIVARTAIPSALQITPSNAGSPKGVPINFTVMAVNTAGVPYAGRTVRYAI